LFPCKNKKNLLKEKPCKTFKKYKTLYLSGKKRKNLSYLTLRKVCSPGASSLFLGLCPWGYNPEGEALRSRPSSPTFSDYLEFKLVVMVTV
jgi:hypothetical protein